MSILKKIFKDKSRLSDFDDYLWDESTLRIGHPEDGIADAKKIYTISNSDADEWRELTPYIGNILEVEGIYDVDGRDFTPLSDLIMYKEEEQPTQKYKDFVNLLSHLNAEEDSLAQEFRDKYITPTRKVKTPVLIVE